jgi:hypothetical protein
MKSLAFYLVIPAAALCLMGAGLQDYEDLRQEVKKELRRLREAVRQLRGLKPAPPAPTPPAAAPQAGAAPAPGISFSGNCVGREETGYAENVQIEVTLGDVRSLEARVDIPKRGNCRFRLADFRQTRQSPYVELIHASKSACTLRLWEQIDHVTLAATDCEAQCTRGAFEYLWPVEFRVPGGGCY